MSKFPSALSKYGSVGLMHQVTSHMHTQTHADTITECSTTPTGTPTYVCHPSSISKRTHTMHITLKKLLLNPCDNWSNTHTHTLTLFHAYTPSINPLCLISLPYPSGPCHPMWSRWATGIPKSLAAQTHTHTHTHTHTQAYTFTLFPFHTPPHNDHRYVKKLCRLKQQPLSAT